MSADEQPALDPPADESNPETNIQRALKRIRTVFRRKQPSRQPSTELLPPPNEPARTTLLPVHENRAAKNRLSEGSPVVYGYSKCASIGAVRLLTPLSTSTFNNLVVDDDDEDDALSSSSGSRVATVYVRGGVQREKAQQLFAKYGLDYNAINWVPQSAAQFAASGRSTIQRIEKPIRMRIRYTCHRCDSTYGASPKCTSCGHMRCKRCSRFPAKKRKNHDDSSPPSTPADCSRHSVEDPGPSRKRRSLGKLSQQPSSTVSNPRRSPGSEASSTGLLPRTPSKVQTDSIPENRQTRPDPALLPRSGARPSPQPTSQSEPLSDGEADAEGAIAQSKRPERVHRKQRHRTRWKCDRCSTTVHEGSKVCTGCEHRRCADCTRITTSMSRPNSVLLPSHPVSREHTSQAYFESRGSASSSRPPRPSSMIVPRTVYGNQLAVQPSTRTGR